MNWESGRFDIQERSEWSPVRWALDIWTWVLIVAAIGAFELFADPLLAGLVICLKYAWSDTRAGVRIGRDPMYRRGGTLRNLFYGRSCLKVAFAGAIGAIVITTGELALGWNFRPERLIAGLILTYTGFFLGTFFLFFGAMGINLRYARPWMDKLLNSQANQFPPRRFGPKNLVPRILVGGIVAASVTLLPYVWVFVFARARVPLAGLVFAIVFFVVWASITWQMLRAFQYLATTPDECWPELRDAPILSLDGPAAPRMG